MAEARMIGWRKWEEHPIGWGAVVTRQRESDANDWEYSILRWNKPDDGKLGRWTELGHTPAGLFAREWMRIE